MIMDDMNQLELASYVLVIIGAFNWGLQGLGTLAETNLNLVSLLAGAVGVSVTFDSLVVLEPAVYLLVGLAGLYQVYFGYQMYEE